MIKSISLLCEMLSILMLLHNFLQRKWKAEIGTVLFLIFDVTGYLLIDKGMVSGYFQIFIYIGFLFYLRYEFRGEKWRKIAATTLLSVFIVIGLQFAGYFLLFMAEEIQWRYNLSNFLAFFAICILLHFMDFGEMYIFLLRAKRRVIYTVYISAAVLTACAFLIKVQPGFSFLETILMFVIFLVVFILGQQWRTERERTLAKERELRVLTQCRESFQELISDVRARQHEFDNQFDAICGLRFSCTTFEELNEKLNEALEFVHIENKYNKLLTASCSPLIKGFLYGNFCRASEKNIEIDYRVELSDTYPLPVEFDIQEIAGILLDNACEAMQDSENRKLSIYMKQDEKKLLIQVENLSRYITQQEIQSFFKLKFSSKGEKRGYGLNNVMHIVEKYNGEIETGNIEKQGENWFSVSISLLTKG